MNPWVCALLIATAGAVGGVVNAFLTDNGGFALPRRENGVCARVQFRTSS
jgi:hypothetical protein